MTPDEYKALITKKKRNKFNAKTTTIDGITFDSKAEAERYADLKLLVRTGRIMELVIHPTFTILINNKLICNVELDFTYLDKDYGIYVYEDVKGGKATNTPMSKLKRKMLEAYKSITVTIVNTPKRRR